MGVIVYIGGFELPDKNAAAHRVLSNAKILRENGKEVIFIGVDKELRYGSPVLKTKKDIQGFESYAVAYPDGKKEWVDYLANINSFLTVMNSSKVVEAVILYNFQALAMAKLMRYCKRNNIKCYADVTEWRSAKGERVLYRILKAFDTWYRMHILHKKMDGLIVISRYLEHYYCGFTKTLYLPALTDTHDSKWNNFYKKDKNRLRLVYAGVPGRKDRLDKLIEAISNVDVECVLDVIGITFEQYLTYYPKHKDILSNCKNIVFHGRLSHLETIEYVKKANYSCFFREDDRVSKAGFPTKFAESISCGTPVLTNNTSNISDYISKDGNVVFVDVLNSSKISEVINDLPFEMKVKNDLFDYRNYLGVVKQFLIKK
ncbi:TPA: glycosyltransferase [Streptococcus suis]|nr:glycosyltransferase [Streptococcus suis]